LKLGRGKIAKVIKTHSHSKGHKTDNHDSSAMNEDTQINDVDSQHKKLTMKEKVKEGCEKVTEFLQPGNETERKLKEKIGKGRLKLAHLIAPEPERSS